MLEEFRTRKIKWDRADKESFPTIRVSSSDENGRRLEVQVVDGSKSQSMAGTNLRLAWETEGGHYFGDDIFTLVDASKGLFEIYYTTEMLSHVGKLDARLQLVDGKGSVGSEPFTIEVFKGMNKEGVQSSNSFTTLEEALQKVTNIDGLIGGAQSQGEALQLKYDALKQELDTLEYTLGKLLDTEKKNTISQHQRLLKLESDMVEVKKKLGELEGVARGRPHHLRVASFNIYHSRIDFTEYRKRMMVDRYDVLGIQEIHKAELGKLDIYNFNNKTYAHYGSLDAPATYGIAIQTNMAQRGSTKFPLPTSGSAYTRWVQRTRVVAYGKTVSIYNVHAEAITSNTVRLQQFAEIKRIMEEDPTPYKILTGDFNVRDVNHYKELGDLKSAQGFQGVWHETWNLSQGAWDTGSIDNVLVSQNIEIMRVGMDGDTMDSDHNLIWADVHLH